MFWKIVAATVGILAINYYIYLRFIAKSRLRRYIKLSILGFLFVVSLTGVLMRTVSRDAVGAGLFDVASAVLSFASAFSWTLFTVSIFIDVPSLFLVRFKRKKLVNPVYQSIIILGSLAITSWGQYEGLKLPEVKEVMIESALIRQPVKIALMTDLHITRSEDIERIKNIVNIINNLHADVILLGGDILDDEIKTIISLAQPLQNLHAPLGVYYVTGNHEYYMSVNDAEVLIKQVGIRQLENSGVLLRDDLYLAGVPDMRYCGRFLRSFDIDQALNDAEQDQFKILLSHEPVKTDKANLVLSGHTHGGQSLPFMFVVPIYSSGMLAGLYGEQDHYNYVSRGVGSWGGKIREFAPYDITLLTVNPVSAGK